MRQVRQLTNPVKRSPIERQMTKSDRRKGESRLRYGIARRASEISFGLRSVLAWDQFWPEISFGLRSVLAWDQFWPEISFGLRSVSTGGFTGRVLSKSFLWPDGYSRKVVSIVIYILITIYKTFYIIKWTIRGKPRGQWIAEPVSHFSNPMQETASALQELYEV
jgi:hypothetical protein